MERLRDRGQRLTRSLAATVASELREARLTAGVSQAQVARASGLCQSRISRTERAESPTPRLEELARHAAVLGLRLSLKLYPDGVAVRDTPQLRLLARLRAQIHPNDGFHFEVPVAGDGDLRAWDALLSGPATVGVDAGTRLRDVQALQRRTELRSRDSGVELAILLVSATHHDRAVLREHRATLASTFPSDTREILARLRGGHAIHARGIVVL